MLDFNWITETIALGEAPTFEDLPHLIEHGIVAILDLRQESQLPLGHSSEMIKHFQYKNVPITDGKPISLDTIEKAISWIYEMSTLGKVYIHCERGISRSPAILMCYFISKRYSTEAAHNLIKSKRKRIWINHSILPSIYEYEKSISDSSREVDYTAYEEIISQGYRKLRRFISYVMKHDKGSNTLEKDDDGYVRIDDIYELVQTRFEYKKWVGMKEIYELINRYGSDGLMIQNDRIKVI